MLYRAYSFSIACTAPFERTAKKKYTYRLAGNTCLAGDVIGDYSFDMPLRIGDRVTFLDGTPLPDILYRKSDGELVTVRTFSYDDFKSRL